MLNVTNAGRRGACRMCFSTSVWLRSQRVTGPRRVTRRVVLQQGSTNNITTTTTSKALRTSSSILATTSSSKEHWYYYNPSRNFSSIRDDETSNTTSTRDAFEILGLSRDFSISDETLKSSYKQLMTELHPDRHQDKSLEEQESLQQRASAVTDAYQELRYKHTRALHLLELLMSNSKEGQQQEDEQIPMSEFVLRHGSSNEELLMEVMEIRETIDELINDESDDNTSMDQRLKLLLEENNQRVDDVCVLLSEAFKTENINLALELTCRLQYWNRIEETLRDNMDEV